MSSPAQPPTRSIEPLAPPERSAPRATITPAQLGTLVAIVLLAWAAVAMIRALRGILVMLLVGMFLAFAMEPAVQFLARRGWRRGAATAAVFALVFLAGVGVVAAITPLFIAQITGLVNTFPDILQNLSGLLERLPFNIDLAISDEDFRQLSQRFSERLETLAIGAAGNVINIGATALGVLGRFLAVGLITFYLVADGPRLRRALARPLPPARQREMLAILELAVAKTGGYIYSRLLLALVAAVAHALFLLLINVPYPVPLGLWMGLMTAFVPVVGVYLGGVLLLIVSGLDSALNALWVLIFLAVYQQIENYLLAPKVQAHTMDLHPAVAFVSVLIGATLLGAVGALLALPAAAISKALLSTYVRRHELIDELEEFTVPGLDDPEPVSEAPEEARA